MRDFDHGKIKTYYIQYMLIYSFAVKDWDMRLIDKTVIPRMPWHDMSLCVVSYIHGVTHKNKALTVY